MTVSADGALLYIWPVSTGVAGYNTPNGAFTPFRKERDHFSRSGTTRRCPIRSSSPSWATPSTAPITKNLGQPASHGCVRLSVKNAAVLWDLVAQHKMAHTMVVLTGEIPGGAGAPVARATPSRAKSAPSRVSNISRVSTLPRSQGVDVRHAARQPGRRLAQEVPRRGRATTVSPRSGPMCRPAATLRGFPVRLVS